MSIAIALTFCWFAVCLKLTHIDGCFCLPLLCLTYRIFSLCYMQVEKELLHKATYFTRHQQGTEKMTVIFIERTHSVAFSPRLCTLFFIFEESAKFCFFEEERKQGGCVFAYSSNLSLGLCCPKALFSVLIQAITGACFSVWFRGISFFFSCSLLT